MGLFPWVVHGAKVLLSNSSFEGLVDPRSLPGAKGDHGQLSRGIPLKLLDCWLAKKPNLEPKSYRERVLGNVPGKILR